MLAYSAGTHPTGYVHPFVQRVMGEVGVQQDNARSKHVEEYLNHSFDYVITVCDNAAANCPVFQGPAKRIHWSTEDPTAARGDNEDRLAAFRSVRDGLGQRVDAFLAGDPAQD